MSQELQTLNERIAERIGKDLVELIPQDQWQEMVDNEVAKFRRQIAPGIIQELIKEQFLHKAKVEIDKLTSTNKWDAEAQECINEDLEKYIGKSAGVILSAMLAPSTQMALQELRRQLGY